MATQVSQFIKPSLGYSLESNLCHLKKEVFSINCTQRAIVQMLNLGDGRLINYAQPIRGLSKTTLIYSALNNALTGRPFNKDYTIIEKSTEVRDLNSRFLAIIKHLNTFFFNVTKEGLNSPLISQNCASGTTRLPDRLPKIKNPQKSLSSKGFYCVTVVWEGIVPFTLHFNEPYLNP